MTIVPQQGSTRDTLATIEEFLRVTRQSPNSDGYISVWEKGSGQTRFFAMTELDKAASYISFRAQYDEPYIGVGVLKHIPPKEISKKSGKLVQGRGKANDVLCTRVIHLDVDILSGGHKAQNLPPTIEDALSLLVGLPEPSVTVHTGGGLHIYWLLDRAYLVEDSNVAETVRAVQAKVQANAKLKGWLVDSTHDLPRVLRSPETFNRKEGRVTPVRLLTAEYGRVYGLGDFAHCLPLIERQTKAKGRCVREDGTPVERNLSTDDALAEAWAEMLSCIPEQDDYQTVWLPTLYVTWAQFNDDLALELIENWSPGGEGEVEAKFASFEGNKYGWSVGYMARLARRHGWMGNALIDALVRDEGRGEREDAARRLLASDPTTWTLNGTRANVVIKEARHLSEIVHLLPRTSKGVVVKSAKNTGKTTAIYGDATLGLVGYLPEDCSLVTITHTMALVESLAKKGGMQSYKDEKALQEATRLAITPNSLPKIFPRLMKQERFEYIVIDEARQMLDAIVGDTMEGRRRQVLNALRQLCQQATQVVMLDSDADETLLQLFARLIGTNEIVVVHNRAVVGDGNLVMYEKGEEVIARFRYDLENGKRGYFATNDATTARALHTQLQDDGYRGRLFSSAELNDEVGGADARAFIADMGRRIVAERLDYVIATPAISTGVSIDEKWFDRVYLYGVGGLHRHTDLAQMVARVRNVADKELHCWVAESGKSGPIEVEDIKAQMLQQAIDAYLSAETSGTLNFNSLVVEDGKPVLTDWVEATYLELAARVQADHNAAQLVLRALFAGLMRESGYTLVQAQIADMGNAYVAETKSLLVEGRRQQKKLKREDFLAAADISELKAHDYLSTVLDSVPLKPRERAELNKWMCKQMFGELSDTVVDSWLKGRAMEQVRTLAFIINPPEAKRADAWGLERVLAVEFASQDKRGDLFREALDLLGVHLEKDVAACKGLDTPLEASRLVEWGMTNQKRLAEAGITVRSNLQERPGYLMGDILREMGLETKRRRVRVNGALVWEDTLAEYSLAMMLNAALFYLRRWALVDRAVG